MIGTVLLCLIAVFVFVVAFRALRFTPKPQPEVSTEISITTKAFFV